jgi:hypothetical protein
MDLGSEGGVTFPKSDDPDTDLAFLFLAVFVALYYFHVLGITSLRYQITGTWYHV